MKTVVSLQELLEFEVRPAGLLAEYLALTGAEIENRWRNQPGLVEVDCQACESPSRTRAFEKHGLMYCQCTECGSLYISPRPATEALAAYYRGSSAIRYWREQILPATAAARAEKIARPRAQWVADGIAEYYPGARKALDLSPIGSTLGQELLGAAPGQAPRASYRLLDLALGGATEVDVHQGGVDTAPETVDIITAFDVIDRSADVQGTVASIARSLRARGVLFATATTISGFDLQVLWDRSPTLTPPDKLNALSIAGLRRVFSTPTWELIELSTPGMLDTENVRRAVLNSPDGSWPRLIRSLVTELDDLGWTDLQAFLQQHRLASFTRLIARRLA